MKNFSDVFNISFKNIINLLRVGYSLKELIYKFYILFFLSKIKSFLLYNFRSRGVSVILHVDAIVEGCRFIELSDNCYIQRGAWLSVPLFEIKSSLEDRSYLRIGKNTRIGPNCTISAMNLVDIKDDVVLGPNVTIVDHYHNYNSIEIPISNQGICSNGSIIIENNSWIGANVVIYSSKTDLIIGKHSIIAANSCVRKSIPPYTIVSGNPAKPIKEYSFLKDSWVDI